jgi:mRNA interferase YafQ
MLTYFLSCRHWRTFNRLSCVQLLELRYRDHPLTGDWQDYRDCHIKPDLVLIYQKPDGDTLRLVRLGSHSELSL